MNPNTLVIQFIKTVLLLKSPRGYGIRELTTLLMIDFSKAFETVDKQV